MKLETSNSQRGLSLIEMMVTVALLAVIILGLVAMFDQTRKALTSGLANVDYQDSGRVALDVIARDMQQMAPAKAGITYVDAANLVAGTNALNFYADFETNINPSYTVMQTIEANSSGVHDTITNVMQRVLFVTQYNQTWSAVGYRVDPTTSATGVGTLYQYRATGSASVGGSGPGVTNDFIYNFSTNSGAFNPVIDGVVNFRVRAYDPNGNLVTPLYVAPNLAVTGSPVARDTYDFGYVFSSNAVPAYVEIELTVLETQTLERYRAMQGANAAAYLTNHIGQMHVFKQRVSIPCLDRTTFP